MSFYLENFGFGAIFVFGVGKKSMVVYVLEDVPIDYFESVDFQLD